MFVTFEELRNGLLGATRPFFTFGLDQG